MPDLMGALRAFPEPGETPPRTQAVAVALMRDLMPGDVVVELRDLGGADALVIVRREIPDEPPPLPPDDPWLRRKLYEEQQRVAADVLRQVSEVYVGGGAEVRADLRAGLALIAHRYGIEVPS